jgi:hypothetical protein
VLAALASVDRPGGTRHRADTEDLVQLLCGKPAVAYRYSAENLRVQLDLVERNPVGDAKIEMLAHRAHLHCRPDSRKPSPQGYDAALCPRMTQQGHFWTTLKWDFTHYPSNDSKKLTALCLSIR